MAMGTCRICFRYINLVDELVCKHCKRKLIVAYPERLNLTFRKGQLVPRNTLTGNILSKSEWFRIEHKINQFYNGVTSDEIDEMNEEDHQRLLNYPTPGYIYLMRSENGYHKIGRATHPIRRRDNLMREYPIQIELIYSVKVVDCIKAERHLLNAFSDKRLQGEWFKMSEQDINEFYQIVDRMITHKRDRKNDCEHC